MKKITAVFLAAAIIFALCSCAVKNSEERKALEKIMADSGFGGVISVWDDGEILCENACGPSNTETGAENKTESLFCVGSISKQCTAAAVMLLRERGLLSVDDRLGKYFPDCPYGDRVTLHQMLCMRSGIAEFYDVTVDRYNIIETPAGTLRKTVTNSGSVSENREKLQKWLFEQPLRYEPGSCYAYTNSNYFLLADIVKQISGKSYHDFVRENIFKPLGMSHSGFVEEVTDDPAWAEGLARGEGNTSVEPPGLANGAGDVASNAADMDAWMAGLSDGTVVSKESFREMTENYSTDSGASYGYGLMGMAYDGTGHPGAIGTYGALDYINPERGLRLFIASNKASSQSYIDSLPSALLKSFIEENNP